MILKELAAKLSLKTEDLKTVLKAVQAEKLSYDALVSKTSLPKATLKRLRANAPDLFLPISNFFVLSPKGVELVNSFVQERFEFTHEHEQEILRVLKTYSPLRPAPKREFDQFYSTPETQVRRIKLFCENHPLIEESVLFIGDDDITSVCLGLIGRAKRIAVADIDQRQLSFLENIARKEKIKLDLYLYDARQKLLEELKGKFDIVFTDPPYTPTGFELFLERELEAINGHTSTIYICFGTSVQSEERYLPIQQVITDFGLAISEVHKSFNAYTGAESMGNRSNLYRLEVTSSTNFNKKVILSRIYTNE